MDRKKLLKKEMLKLSKENKMADKNIMQFKDYRGQSNFQAFVDPFTKTTKDELKYMIGNSKCNKNYYFEWTNHKCNVKPFYDVDVFYQNEELYKMNIEPIQNKVRDILKKLYPDTTIAISSSHGEKIKLKSRTVYEEVNGKKVKKGIQKTEIKGFAISYHFVMCDYQTTIPELKEFNEKHNLYDVEWKGTKIFDKAVYRDNGNMRFLYSYKPNDNRQKIPVNYTEDYCILKHVIQSTDATNHFKRPLPNDSPPVSPTTSDDEEVKEVKEEKDDDDDLMEFVPQKNPYKAGELQEILNVLTDECYEYDNWTRVGLALHNITDGDEVGFGFYNEWSEKDDGYDGVSELRKKWKSFGKKKTGNKLGLTFLRKLRAKYQPKNQQSLQDIYTASFEKNNDSMHHAKMEMLKEMNNRVIFVKETGDYIILDKKQIRKENGELIKMPCWYLKNATKTKDHFLKQKFPHSYEDEAGKNKSIVIDPFKLWCEWIDRREVRAIGFDPRDDANSDLFNLWNGFNISKEVADAYDEAEAQPILDHIRELWCSGDDNAYEYVLNYFSHIIQKPHVKTGVLLALKSKQGGGKGIILDKLAQIIGDNHYAQNSNANFLFGDFNGQLEGKILINLDEAFWGGDKKLEGVIKNKITEKRQTINKKNKENYIVDCYANYIITTNNDWFAGTSEDDRRHYCLELDNKLSGRMNAETLKHIQPVLDAPCEAFAKVLYNRDISDFKPRMFKKTKLLQEQVEMNWNSPKVWYNNVMRDGGFEYDGHFIEWNKVLKISNYDGNKNYGTEIKNKKKEKRVIYTKEWIFKCYDRQSYNGRKFDNSSFWREIKKNCLSDLYEEKKLQLRKERKLYMFLPSLEEARAKWNEMQEYDYDYNKDDDDEWELDDCDISSDDE
jgi:hypothetical protein